MKKIACATMAVLVCLLTGCSGTPDCLKTQRYSNATTLPPIKTPAGLQAPKGQDAMKIPQVGNGPVSAYAKAPPGTEQNNPVSRCLTTPPPISVQG